MARVSQVNPDKTLRGSGPKESPDPLTQFVSLSVALSGFDTAELWGTGMVRPYFQVLDSIVGGRVLGALLSEWTRLETLADADARRPDGLLLPLFEDPMLGPVTRNLTTLWYLGLWTQLPSDWRDLHGAHALDVTHYVSGKAYTEGLVWNAIHAHPQGAKPPGYGSWSLKPASGADHGR